MHFVYASEHTKSIALKGNIEAQLRLGFLYSKGAKKDLLEASYWMKMAAENGSPLACRYLGNAHLYGKGASKSLELSKRWFLMSVRYGEKIGLVSLAVCSEIENDWCESLAWYKIAYKSDIHSIKNAIHRVSKLVDKSENNLIPQKILELENSIGLIKQSSTNQPESDTKKISKLELKDGYSYWGESKNEFPHGYGKKKLGYKTVYQGEFKQGLEHGFGTSYDLKGKISFQGKWLSGEPVKTVIEKERNLNNY